MTQQQVSPQPTYWCEDCGQAFAVRRGSKRRYCTRCITRRESEAGKLGAQKKLAH